MTQIHRGHCLCGALRYECGPPLSPPCFCHCESCRRGAGAHAVAWATVAHESFRVVTGTLRAFVSSPPVRRQYCDQCGTPITYWNQQSPQTIDITVATLDSPDAMTPVDHIWMEDAPAWDRPQDGLPQFARSREESE